MSQLDCGPLFPHRRRVPIVNKPLRTCAVLFLAGLAAASAETRQPYSQATVTRLQNKVAYGDAARTSRREAQSGDVVRAQTYLLTETDSRAELKYPDGSIVRIGQNTVFTFEADTRTLTLDKGSLIFYIPKGHGGGTIRTASITAAITGTLGKVADNMIAILEGEVTLVPSGDKVPAGWFALRNPDGSITIDRFDPSSAMAGKLMEWGPIADFDESQLLTPAPPSGTIVREIMDQLERPDRMQNHPAAQELFLPTPKPGKPREEDKDKTILIAPTPAPRSRPGEPTPFPSGVGGAALRRR
jgi:hypothetical protein